jgi:ArsR family transcriptional regulator
MAEIIGPPKTVKVSFSLEPVYNVIGSLALFNMAQDFTGLNEWVYQSVKALSPEQLRTNNLVLQDAYVHLAGADWPSFPAWVDDLATRDAVQMRDRALQAWLADVSRVLGETPDPVELLADRAAYLVLVQNFFCSHDYDLSLWEEMHAWLNDPAALQDLTVTHLRAMWELVAPEWERNLPLLEESIAAFQSLDFTGLTAVQALQKVILRELPSNLGEDRLADVEHLVFIPSAHTGPYVLMLNSVGDTPVYMAFGARIPQGVPAPGSALSRSELLMRLNALADDTRLRIVELLAQQDEQSTSDIKAQLAISQSAASRHLEHLTATGYLLARRQQGANFYQFNPSRVEQTFQALREFCRMT